ncbi:unnamed protein product [Fraxinus pennsylvanica]|uniref:Pentatricopeptide repeat-containing protein n=1 Tax=Fraxinus pennsylvanica TaxID=56036 RepID=A0AAD1ZIX8_9LAMI|nr:unnamed protein product [Fraxinus pennsylvanica]
MSSISTSTVLPLHLNTKQTHRLQPERLALLIGKSKSIKPLSEIHAFVIRHGLESHPVLNFKLLRSYCSLGHLEHSVSLFNRTPNPSVYFYTAIIHGHAINDLHEQAFLFYVQMLFEDVEPNAFTLSAVLKACPLESGKSLHCQVLKLGLEFDTYEMPNSPLGMLLGGFCSLSWRLLHQQSLLKEQDHMLGHTKAGEFEKSLHVLSAPRLVYLHPLNYLFISSTGHLKSDEAQEHLHQTQENGSNPDKPTSDFKNLKYASDTTALETMDNRTRADDFSTLRLNSNGLVGSDHLRILADFGVDNELLPELTPNHTKLPALKMNSALEAGPSILQIFIYFRIQQSINLEQVLQSDFDHCS